MKKKNAWTVAVETFGESRAELLVVLGIVAWYTIIFFILGAALHIGIIFVGLFV